MYVLFISETKIDDSFLVDNFAIEGFTTPDRFDRRDNNGGRIMLHLREDIPSNLLATGKSITFKDFM